jgi:ribonuclease D
MVTVLEGDLTPFWYTAARIQGITGCDTETTGLDREKDTLQRFQMFIPDTGTVLVHKLDSFPTLLVRLLNDVKIKKIFHFAIFDIEFLMRRYPYMNPKNIACTKIAVKMLDPNRTRYIDPIDNKGAHKLRTLLYHYFGIVLNKDIAVSDWTVDTLSDQQINYAENDVLYLPALLKKLEDDLAKYNLLSLAYKAYAHIPTDVLLRMKIGTSDVYGY